MKRVPILLTDEQLAFLLDKAKRDDTSVSELVRRAVDALYLTEMPGEEVSDLVGDGEDG